MRQPLNLEKRLEIRKKENSLRKLSSASGLIDFSSNDYLGFSKKPEIYELALSQMEEKGLSGLNGATGSRLLTGNHSLYDHAEYYLKEFHDCEAALIFNSGYDTNVGFFGSVPQRNDIILFDELVHASIRDGIRLSPAKAFKFGHNDLNDLEKLLIRFHTKQDKAAEERNIYIVTESVFSMDGDIAPLKELVELSDINSAFLIVDEAHATGVFGKKGEGVAQALNLHDRIFARIITFGKALGAHGAAVLCSEKLRDYLINFCRSFIYTTALPPHSVATIIAAYKTLNNSGNPHHDYIALIDKIKFFRDELENHGISSAFIESRSAIQCCVIPGNNEVKKVALHLQDKGFDVKPILSPTVSSGKERIRICLHSFNYEKDIKDLVEQIANFIK